MSLPSPQSSDFFTDAEYLRRQADRCLQLAEFSSSPDAVATLASLAETYLAQATLLATGRNPDDREDRFAA